MSNKHNLTSVLFLTVIGVSGCTAELNRNLTAFNQSLKQVAPTTQTTPAFTQNARSPNAEANFQTKLEVPSSNAALSGKWPVLKPLAEKIVGLSACGTGPYPNNGGANEQQAWLSIGRWTDPDSKRPFSNSFPLAIWHTQYHPKSSCMGILRIDKWSAPSKNTLSMRVQFVSEVSDETVFVTYLFKMLEDGTWLFSNAEV